MIDWSLVRRNFNLFLDGVKSKNERKEDYFYMAKVSYARFYERS